MYSNKENVNILTATLVAYGVKHAVVCPGSRNAPIVHNLNECPDIECHPVTDERSAGFYALGMSVALDEPVVVCVTSGSAMLNLSPAVAEAWYRHTRLIVVSADRPQMWIDQLVGQTIPQEGAFGSFVAKSVSMIEPHNDDELWYCQRLAHEAFVASHRDGGRPVHINVPISRPLFEFSVEQLPIINKVEISMASNGPISLPQIAGKRILIVIGQLSPRNVLLQSIIRELKSRFIVLGEALSMPMCSHADYVLERVADDAELLPEVILYFGDNLVSNRLRSFLRKAKDASVYRFTNDETEFAAPFQNLSSISLGANLADLKALPAGDEEYNSRWKQLLAKADLDIDDRYPPYSHALAVKTFEQSLEDMEYDYHLHYANSTAIRLANIYASEHVYCNRGVNGIEGCLSAAAGHSVVTSAMVFCVIGDLAFFYDQNALWNTNLKGNLRILLLNNHCGGIFNTLPGLSQSPAKDSMVAARHNADARGICTQNDIGYLSAKTPEELRLGIAQLLTATCNRPMLLEVFTDE